MKLLKFILLTVVSVSQDTEQLKREAKHKCFPVFKTVYKACTLRDTQENCRNLVLTKYNDCVNNTYQKKVKGGENLAEAKLVAYKERTVHQKHSYKAPKEYIHAKITRKSLLAQVKLVAERESKITRKLLLAQVERNKLEMKTFIVLQNGIQLAKI